MHVLGRTRAGMRSPACAVLTIVAAWFLMPAVALLQEPGSLGVLQGGVPTGQATTGEITLSLTEAILLPLLFLMRPPRAGRGPAAMH